MDRKRVLGMILVLLLVSAAFASGCSQNMADSSGEEIRIGVTGPLSGPAANAGVALKQGMELAVEEWNRQGGIEMDGKKLPVKLFFQDDQSKPEQGVSAAEKLINQEKIHFLIGDAFSSSVTMAIMELAPQYEIPILSGEPVSEAIAEKVQADPEKYKYYWKGSFGSSAYGESVYETYRLLEKTGKFTPKNKTIAFIVEDTDYGRSNADAAGQLFKQAGWNIAAMETVPLGHTDFYPQLSKMGSLQPDVIVSCFTSLSSGVALTKQYKETRTRALHLAIYYPLRPEFVAQAGEASEGLIWTPLFFDPDSFERHLKFAQMIREKFGVTANSDHASGYDTMNNALHSIAEAQSLDPEKIIERLSQLNREGVLGRYVFDQSNHQIKSGPEFIPVPAAQIQDGKNVIIWPENVAKGTYRTQPWMK